MFRSLPDSDGHTPTTSSMAVISKTLPRDWKYVSEGGATIVFSYIGPHHPLLDGKVLRLRKSPTGTIHDPSHAPIQAHSEEPEEPDDPMIEFQHKCMERLIPCEHLPKLESVRVDGAWLDALGAFHDAERPLDRRQKDQIDVSRRKGVLATDLVGGEGLAVEIKPKWAFLPSPTHLSPATRPIKTQTCRFCMHSHMKAKNGELVAVGFCPLDLYSGNITRTRHAIRNLWDAWDLSDAAVNNLKIFVQGKPIKPSQKSSMWISSQEPTDLREAFISAILPLLVGTPVLRILSQLQRTLDPLDIEGLSALWSHVQSTLSSSPSTPIGISSTHLPSPDPTLVEWTLFLDTYLSRHETEGINMAVDPNMGLHQDRDRTSYTDANPETLRYHLLAYLLSATFKDCSIMLRLDLLGSDAVHPSTTDATNTPTDATINHDQVTVIDLDPKGMGRLHKWEKLDGDIVQAYSSMPLPRKVCIDVG